MWPMYLDMTKEECIRTLRRLEVEAYANLISAFRAQGGLCTEKHKLLKEIATVLNINQERHRAEIRRVVNDERLATVAHCMSGDDTSDDWAMEGRRLVPLIPRVVPQTAYSVIADEEANKISVENEKLPLPAQTERKRPPQNNSSDGIGKNIIRATSEMANFQNMEEIGSSKKRKGLSMESSSLAQHLMMAQTQPQPKKQMKHRAPSSSSKHGPKPIATTSISHEIHQQQHHHHHHQPSLEIQKAQATNIEAIKAINLNPVNENQQPKSKSPKPQVHHINNPITSIESGPKTIKICSRKTMTPIRPQTQSQKVIIVSSSQGTTTPSILQRTLTIPFVKTLSMKNIERGTTQSPTTLATSSSSQSQKPKLLTVQTKMKPGSTAKHVNIPFIQGVQLQALQNKRAIKMVPLSSSKVQSKSSLITTTSGSMYIMNSNLAKPNVTSSHLSPIITEKAQNHPTDQQPTPPSNKDQKILILKNEQVSSIVPIITNSDLVPTIESFKSDKTTTDEKSSVLADILMASGVLPAEDADVDNCDIESQITQLTEIPNTTTESSYYLPPTLMRANSIAKHFKNATKDEKIVKAAIKQQQQQQPIIIKTATVVTEQPPVDRSKNVDSLVENVINLTQPDVVEFETALNVTQEPIPEQMDRFHNSTEKIQEEILHNFDHNLETIEQTITTEPTNFVILDNNETGAETLNFEDEPHHSEEIEFVGRLDPETGMYSTSNFEIIEDNQTEIPQSYVINMETIQNSELDIPPLQ